MDNQLLSACGLICNECNFFGNECQGCYLVLGAPFGQKNMFPAVSARYTSVLLWTGNMPVAANVQNFPVNCLKG
jgi:hypothetical protein